MPENTQLLEASIVSRIFADDVRNGPRTKKGKDIFRMARDFGLNKDDAGRVVRHFRWGELCMRIAHVKEREAGMAAIKKHLAASSGVI